MDSDSDAQPRPGLRISPLDVRFSQKKMRHLFTDDRSLAEATALVRTVRLTEDEAALCDAHWRLEAPFPAIEVLRWRCKLRDTETGRPLRDETGADVFDSEERWFTLDNRRLYCLQRCALACWPKRCVVSVVAHMGKSLQSRALRKFRTLDEGCSIMVGSALDKVPFVQWSWRTEIKRKSEPSAQDVGASGFVEISKKVSCMLRNSNMADDEGWVHLGELMQEDALKGLTEERFRSLITESNEKHIQYELVERETGWMLRAAEGKGRTRRRRRRPRCQWQERAAEAS